MENKWSSRPNSYLVFLINSSPSGYNGIRCTHAGLAANYSTGRTSFGYVVTCVSLSVFMCHIAWYPTSSGEVG